MKRALLIAGGVLLGIGVAGGALMLAMRHPLPDATAGPDGDELARRVAETMGVPAWEKLGVVRWTLGGNHHLWDKRRGFLRLQKGDDEVLLDLTKLDGRAFSKGEEQSGEAKKRLLDKAYASFCNDSFWLNPLAKMFDAGTSRSRLEIDGKPALLIAYASGGVTPGDKFLWLLDEAGRPRAWRIYAKIVPIAGVHWEWDGWVDLGGAKVATVHRILGISLLGIHDLGAAEKLEQLEPGPDPFAGLEARR